MDRRHFLGATLKAAAGIGLMRSSLNGPAAELPRRTARLAVIDTHTHFYDPKRPQGVPWPPPGDKVLDRTVLPKDYLSLPVPKAVRGTVVVEASPWLEDNQWILDLAEKEPFILGFVGNLAVGVPEFAANLKRFAANKVFRGIRLGSPKLEQAKSDTPLLQDLKLLAARDLSLDLVGGPEILGFADQVATVIPDLRIVIDHLAGVAIDGKAPPTDWLREMRAIARRRNIFCKVSGLVEGTGRADGTAPREVGFYRPVLDAMGDLFGPARLIYASNWPVSELFAPLATVEGIIAEYFRDVGPEAERAVFHESGFAAYRWKRAPIAD
jgi:L-fuconolactonase